MIGPVRPAGRIARALADLWMLFPEEAEYREWFERAGFTDVQLLPVAPDWYRERRVPYAVAASGVKPAAGASPLALGAPAAAAAERAPLPKVAARFALGSLAGLAFIPIALIMTLRARLERRAA